VWTITSKQELDNLVEHLKAKASYDQYIVQSLIGNAKWSSKVSGQTFYHIGTVPDKHQNIYVADLRMMIHYNYEQGGFAPLALYARRAALPLNQQPDGNAPAAASWDVLGTNLSYKKPDGTWDTDTKRLIIVDRRDVCFVFFFEKFLGSNLKVFVKVSWYFLTLFIFILLNNSLTVWVLVLMI